MKMAELLPLKRFPFTVYEVVESVLLVSGLLLFYRKNKKDHGHYWLLHSVSLCI